MNRQHFIIARAFVFIAGAFLLLFANSAETLAQQKADTTGNSVSYLDKILIKANVNTQIDRYTLKQDNARDFQLLSNNEYKVFLSLDYEFIGFSYGFSPKILNANKDDDLKGKSGYTNYRFLIFLGQWLQTAEFDRVKGFYAANTADYIPGWRNGIDPYIQFRSLKSSRWSMSTAYVFNRNFSFKNIVYQTEWQKQSAGSFVPTLFYDMTHTSFNEYGIQSAQRDFNIRLGLGYYYTFVLANRFFISPNFVPSIGLRFSKATTTAPNEHTEEKNTYLVNFLEGGLKAGYNSDKFIIGAGLNISYNWYSEDAASRVYNDRFFGILYFGYRFNAPKLLHDAYDKFNKQL